MAATVVAVRPLGAAAPVRVLSILAWPGLSTASGSLVEIILRDESGQALSIVQPAASSIRPGARVVVDPGNPARIRVGSV